MKRWLLCLMFCLGAFCASHARAQAATCNVTFSSERALTAAQLTALEACIGNIDRANIGSAGLDASSLKPTSTPSATFGGTLPYNFPAGINFATAAGGLTSTTSPKLGFYFANPSGPHDCGHDFFGDPNDACFWSTTLGSAFVGLSDIDQQLTLSGNTQFPYQLILQNVAPSPTPGAPSLIQAANLGFYAPAYPNVLSEIYAGISDDGAGNDAPYVITEVNAVSPYGTPGTTLEAIQAVPNGHVGMPFDILSATITTPGSWPALATCGTQTITFSYPFVTTALAHANPECTTALMEDLTDSTAIWVVGIASVSPTAVTYNYAPLVATVASHNLTLTAECHEGPF